MSEELQIEVLKTPREVIINFNGLPHVILDRRVIFAVHSWIDERSHDDRYCIEFCGRGGDNVPLTYDSFEKWARILRQLPSLHLFDEAATP